MKNYELTKTQTDLLRRIEEIDYKAAWWGPNSHATRIYLRFRKDVKCWLEFDDPENCEGVTLKVYIDDCGQHPNWYKGQRAKVKGWAADALQEAVGQRSVEQLPTAVIESQAELLQPDSHVQFLTGGQPGEDNDERAITGTIVSVRRQPAPTGTIGDAEEVIVTLHPDDNSSDYNLYTWRGVLRYGSGAQIVRWAKVVVNSPNSRKAAREI